MRDDSRKYMSMYAYIKRTVHIASCVPAVVVAPLGLEALDSCGFLAPGTANGHF